MSKQNEMAIWWTTGISTTFFCNRPFSNDKILLNYFLTSAQFFLVAQLSHRLTQINQPLWLYMSRFAFQPISITSFWIPYSFIIGITTKTILRFLLLLCFQVSFCQVSCRIRKNTRQRVFKNKEINIYIFTWTAFSYFCFR